MRREPSAYRAALFGVALVIGGAAEGAERGRVLAMGEAGKTVLVGQLVSDDYRDPRYVLLLLRTLVKDGQGEIIERSRELLAADCLDSGKVATLTVQGNMKKSAGEPDQWVSTGMGSGDLPDLSTLSYSVPEENNATAGGRMVQGYLPDASRLVSMYGCTALRRRLGDAERARLAAQIEETGGLDDAVRLQCEVDIGASKPVDLTVVFSDRAQLVKVGDQWRSRPRVTDAEIEAGVPGATLMTIDRVKGSIKVRFPSATGTGSCKRASIVDRKF